MKIKAFCYRSGQIAFGRRAPRGALVILGGEAAALRRAVEIHARHAHDGRTFLVPGLPEAASDEEAFGAVRVFRTRVCDAIHPPPRDWKAQEAAHG